MRVEYPWFLIAFLLLLIPIFIHLYNWRKFKKIQFPDISMLEQLVMETKKYAKIKNWKLLITRLFLFAFLIIAFAQPFFNKENPHDENVIIYIDNSQSLNFGDGQKTKLEQSKESAIKLLKQLPDATSVQLITNSTSTASGNKASIIAAISNIQACEASKNLYDLFASQKEVQGKWFLFSDFQNITVVPDSTLSLIGNEKATVTCVDWDAMPQQNLYFDSVYFVNTVLDVNKPNPIVVRIKNAVAKEFQTQLQVSQQGKAVAFKTVNSNDYVVEDTLEVLFNASEWQTLTLSVTDFPLSFDDTFRYSFQNQAHQRVLVINEGNPNTYLQTAIQSFDKYQIQNVATSNIPVTIDANIIVLQNISVLTADLANHLLKWWQDGKDIIWLPNEQLQLASFNSQLQEKTGIYMEEWITQKQDVYKILHQHPIFSSALAKISDQVSLPTTLKNIKISANLKGSPQNLMTYRDGSPFLSTYKIDNGTFTLLASPLNPIHSNFATSDYFAPFLYNYLLQGGGQDLYTVTINSKEAIKIPNLAQSRWYINDNGAQIYPDQKAMGNWIQMFLPKSIEHSGYYVLQNEASPTAITLAVNTNKAESQMTFASKEEIEKHFTNAENITWVNDKNHLYSESNNTSFPLWKIATILALIALALETYWAIFQRNK